MLRCSLAASRNAFGERPVQDGSLRSQLARASGGLVAASPELVHSNHYIGSSLTEPLMREMVSAAVLMFVGLWSAVLFTLSFAEEAKVLFRCRPQVRYD